MAVVLVYLSAAYLWVSAPPAIPSGFRHVLDYPVSGKYSLGGSVFVSPGTWPKALGAAEECGWAIHHEGHPGPPVAMIDRAAFPFKRRHLLVFCDPDYADHAEYLREVIGVTVPDHDGSTVIVLLRSSILRWDWQPK